MVILPALIRTEVTDLNNNGCKGYLMSCKSAKRGASPVITKTHAKMINIIYVLPLVAFVAACIIMIVVPAVKPFKPSRR